jgi:hypothetical protein
MTIDAHLERLVDEYLLLIGIPGKEITLIWR